MVEYFDTHCHIHSARSGREDNTAKKWHQAGEDNPVNLLNSANKAGVSRMICVGTDTADSLDCVTFAQNHKNVWTSVGVHPHEAKDATSDDLRKIRSFIKKDQELAKSDRKIVAVGEVGLDYYYEHSPKTEQIKLLEEFLQMAQDYDLPLIFHVRDAYADFWPILENFGDIKGVLHSFTAGVKTLKKANARDLFIGLNGIMTFTRDQAQLDMARQVPIGKLLLETDSPYLSPKPVRGQICKPQHVVHTAEFLETLRTEKLQEIADRTTANASELFNI